MKNSELDELHKISMEIRQDVLRMAYNASSSHIGAALSIIDILAVLYFEVLKIDPYDNNRDKFILSKGHASSALYAVLAKKGFISNEILDSYYTDDSPLSGHPKRNSIPGVEASTGSLGHGLAIGCGLALSDKNDSKMCKTVVLMGDGECNEGTVWESAMFASSKELNNLIVIIDNNELQGLGRVKEVTGLYSLEKKWKAFNWNTVEIDGHDKHQIYKALTDAYQSKNNPAVIIAHTIKGKGINFMEDELKWHYKSPNKEEYIAAMKELSR